MVGYGEFQSENLKKKEVVFVLIGTYEHNIDGKNRLFVPAKFRAILGNEFIFKVNRSKYPSIQLYSKAQFQKEVDEALAKITDEYNKKRAEAKRYLGAGEAVCDAQGRIVLTGMAAKIAKLEKSCVLTGFGDYVEVMSPSNYKKYLASITASNAADEQALEDEKNVYRQYQAEGQFLNAGI